MHVCVIIPTTSLHHNVSGTITRDSVHLSWISDIKTDIKTAWLLTFGGIAIKPEEPRGGDKLITLLNLSRVFSVLTVEHQTFSTYVTCVYFVVCDCQWFPHVQPAFLLPDKNTRCSKRYLRVVRVQDGCNPSHPRELPEADSTFLCGNHCGWTGRGLPSQQEEGNYTHEFTQGIRQVGTHLLFICC